MSTIDRVAPYVEQLLDNDNVQANLQRAATRARQAYGGAKGKKNKKKALTDNRVRQRLTQSVAAARDAVVALKRGRDEEARKQARRRQRRRALVLALAAGGAVVMSSRDARSRVLGRLGGVAGSSEDPTESGELSETGPTLVDPDKSSV
jgi:hypothetical protein